MHPDEVSGWTGMVLPFNRKERYFTATVLPMIIGCRDFDHLDRFTDLCGLPAGVVGSDPTWPDFQFFTEYGFADSVFTPSDKLLWPDTGAADTPDLVLSGVDWLITVEAKMFMKPSAGELTKQLDRQQKVIHKWLAKKQVSSKAHVLLMPRQLAQSVGDLRARVITWEQVLNAYRDVAPRYWCDVLSQALSSYEELVSHGGASGINALDKITGKVLVVQYARGSLEFDYVGRRGGLKRFREDVADGTWWERKYEVRRGPPPKLVNWFPIEEFVEEVTQGGLTLPSLPSVSGAERTPLAMRHAIFLGTGYAGHAKEFSAWCENFGAAVEMHPDWTVIAANAPVVGDPCMRVFYVMPPSFDNDAAIGNMLRLCRGEPIPVDEYPGFVDTGLGPGGT